MITGRYQVSRHRPFGERLEAVRKPFGNVQRLGILSRQLGGVIRSITAAVAAQVQDNIQNPPCWTIDKLTMLVRWHLKMHAPYNRSGGNGIIAFLKFEADALIAEKAIIEHLPTPSPRVGKC